MTNKTESFCVWLLWKLIGYLRVSYLVVSIQLDSVSSGPCYLVSAEAQLRLVPCDAEADREPRGRGCAGRRTVQTRPALAHSFQTVSFPEPARHTHSPLTVLAPSGKVACPSPAWKVWKKEKKENEKKKKIKKKKEWTPNIYLSEISRLRVVLAEYE